MPSMPRLRRISAGHLAVVIASAALFVALDGPTQAAGLITGKDIKDNSIKSVDIKDRQLKGVDVKDDALTGADVAESSLAKVPSAALADSATAVAPNAITGASVADGSLKPVDFAQGFGRFTFNIPSTPANGCSYSVVTLQAGVDFRDSAILLTPDHPIGALDVSITTTQSDSVGLARMVVCNATGGAIDPASATFDWIAFKVVG